MKAAAAAQRTVRTQRTVTLPKPVQLKCGCGASAERSADECEQCSRGRKLQTKLRVNGPGDALEQEADRLAERVLSMPQPSHALHASAVSTATATGTTEAPAVVGEALSESGAALDADTRAFFEPRFGYDFSRVRIHASSLAERSADAVGARAFTVGSDVVFAPGEYAPGSSSGRRLLAHELAHVMQQEGPVSLSRMPVLQREPKKSKMAHILSLEDVLKDPIRNAKQKLNQQRVAHVYKNTSGRTDNGNAPVTLKTGEQVWIIKTLPGELWMQIESGAFKDFRPDEKAYVLAAFVEETPTAITTEPKPAPPQAEKPAEPAKPLTEDEKVQALRAGLPAEYRWVGDPDNLVTNALISGYLFSKYLWFHAPQYRQRAINFIEKVYKEYHENKLGVYEYEKKFGGLWTIQNNAMSRFFLAARDAMKHFREYVRKTNGGAFDERNWNDDIKMLMHAEEPFAVLLDGRKPGEMKKFGKLRSMMSLSAPKAFVTRVLDGAKSQISDKEYKLLARKLAQSSMLALPLMPVTAAGTAVGVAEDIYEQLKGLYEIASAPVEMGRQMIELIMMLMMDEDGARQLGVAMGEQEGKEIGDLATEDLITFTYKLYKKVAPLVVSIVLSFVSGGSAGAARMGAAFEKILSKSRKAQAIVSKIKALMPEKKLPRTPNLPDHAPKLPDAHRVPDTPKAPDAPKVEAPKVEAPKASVKRPDFDDAIAARRWAKDTLKLTDKTLEGMSPGAYKRLGELPDADLDRIDDLSEAARRYLLGCESPCPVDGPDLKKKLGKYTNNQIENLAKARAEKRRKAKGKALKKPDEPAPPADVPDVAPKPTKEWAKKALDLDDATVDTFGPAGIKDLFSLAESDLTRIRKLPRDVRRALLDSGKKGKVKLADIQHHLDTLTNDQITMLFDEGSLGAGVRFTPTDKQAARLRRITEALNDDTKWGEVTARDRLRLGKAYDAALGKLVRDIYSATKATVMHYTEVNAALFKKLAATGGRVLITEGRISGVGRFDMALIDFDKKVGVVIDIASTSTPRHEAKTRGYKKALEKMLKGHMSAKEMLYTGKNGEVLEKLKEVVIE